MKKSGTIPVSDDDEPGDTVRIPRETMRALVARERAERDQAEGEAVEAELRGAA